MKIRTDFVTNSSSSGYVVITVVDGNGRSEDYQYDYDSGYGGYLWNMGIDDGIEKDLGTIKTGEELAKILKKWFGEYVLESATANEFVQLVRAMKALRAFSVEEVTRFDGGGEESGELTCRFNTPEHGWGYRYKGESIDDNGKVTERIEDGNPLLDIADEKEPQATGFEQYFDKNPEIAFEGKIFVFSGMGYWGGVPDTDPVVARVIKRGGLLRQKVSGKTDYLIIGPELWGTSNLEAAIEQRRKGKEIKIVLLKDLKKWLEKTNYNRNQSGLTVKHCDLFDDIKKLKTTYSTRCGWYGDFRCSKDYKELKNAFSEFGWFVEFDMKGVAEFCIERHKKQFDYPFVIIGDLTTEKLDAGQSKKEYQMIEKYKTKFGFKVYAESDIVGLGKRVYPAFPEVQLDSIEGLTVCCRGTFARGYVYLNNCIKSHGGIPQKGNPTMKTDVFVVADKEIDTCCVNSPNIADEIERLLGYYKKNKKPLLFTESQFTALGFFTKPGGKEKK